MALTARRRMRRIELERYATAFVVARESIEVTVSFRGKSCRDCLVPLQLPDIRGPEWRTFEPGAATVARVGRRPSGRVQSGDT